jgi:hypothetical protein
MGMKGASPKRKNPEGLNMSKLTKTVGALAVAALVAGLATTEAQAKPKFGLIGAGIATGVILGAATAATVASPMYVGPGYRCMRVAQYDAWGNFMGTRRVCDYY